MVVHDGSGTLNVIAPQNWPSVNVTAVPGTATGVSIPVCCHSWNTTGSLPARSALSRTVIPVTVIAGTTRAISDHCATGTFELAPMKLGESPTWTPELNNMRPPDSPTAPASPS
jgi:hypothetical protein